MLLNIDVPRLYPVTRGVRLPGETFYVNYAETQHRAQ